MSQFQDPSSRFDYPAYQVIQKEDRNLPREGDPTGEAETLKGRISMKQMGMYAQKAQPKHHHQHQQQKDNKQQSATTLQVDAKKTTHIQTKTGQTVLNVEISDAIYKPKTKENRLVYEQLLSLLSSMLGGESQETLKSVADEVLAVLKNENTKNSQKKIEIEALLGYHKLEPEAFSVLLQNANDITDYTADIDEEGQQDANIHQIGQQIQLPFDLEDEGEDKHKHKNEQHSESSNEEDIKERDDDEEDMSDKDNDNEDNTKKMGLKEDENEVEQLLQQEGNKYYLSASQIDVYWLQNELATQFEHDPQQIKEVEHKVLSVLNLPSDNEVENRLVQILNYDRFDLIKLILQNRHKIYFLTKIGLISNTDLALKEALIQEMRQSIQGQALLDELDKVNFKGQDNKDMLQFKQAKLEAAQINMLSSKQDQQQFTATIYDSLQSTALFQDEDFAKLPKKTLDLEELKFQQGSHLLANEKCRLPEGAYKLEKKGYDEVYIPAQRHVDQQQYELIKRKDLPKWAQTCFPEDMDSLNRIQSQVYPCAFKSNENMLVCAPTGAGKTNIALLAMLQVIQKYMRKDLSIDKSQFKIVYIAPMKALVNEMVGNFSKRLAPFNIVVRELTGDSQMSKQQIQETQIIVATPEKWDIVTRKAGEKTFTEQVKLLIIDEIHLLHDIRGPVLEALVSRTIRLVEQTQEQIRLIGLSATLPNYQDVGAFLRVDANKGLFFFDHSFRPVPLEQQFVGITEKKAVRKMLLMNEILYEKVMERAGRYQMIVFVHSRRDTIKTAKAIRDMALANDDLQKFLNPKQQSKAILESELEHVLNKGLKEVIIDGIGIHHAGLAKVDRRMVEDMFHDGHIQLLISTSTLAWGVNLPAHTVIIKGTQIYSPEAGKWTELSPQDILQMMGRAGRPGFDTQGEGIILTGYLELKYYLSLLNEQLPIESQFLQQMADQLNAEVVLGGVTSVKEAVTWLGYTYLYLRMLRNPALYTIANDQLQDDRLLIKHRANLVHSAACILDKSGLIKYEKKTGQLQPTVLGRIASHYYIKHQSMSIYMENIKPNMGILELFKVFTLSAEFQFIPIREEEKAELARLMEQVPLPVKGSINDPPTKINVLLQAYISQIKMDGLALNADMVYVTQSAGRIMRGLSEIFVKKGWASIGETAIDVAKMVERRMWGCMSPLRQFPHLPEEIIRRVERKEQVTWEHLYQMSSLQLGDLIKYPKFGKALHKYVHQFPRLELNAFVQPLTRSALRMQLTVTPDFHWDDTVHGHAEPFWLFVADCDGEQLLYTRQFAVKRGQMTQNDANNQQNSTLTFEFTVPLFEPLHPIYSVRVVSDRWLQCSATLPISFKNLILPQKFAPLTQLLDRPLLALSAMKFHEAEQAIKQVLKVQQFNSVQTQCFAQLYQSGESVFLGSSTGSGKTLCALLAIFREVKAWRDIHVAFSQNISTNNNTAIEDHKVVYISAVDATCKHKYKLFSDLFKSAQPGSFLQTKVKVGLLTGVLSLDMKLIDSCNILVSSCSHWDVVSRRWKQRKALQKVSLLILDDLHLLQTQGSVMEVVGSRMRMVGSHLAHFLRVVGLAVSIANYRDVAEWLGATPSHTFNFHTSVRPVPVEVAITGFDQNQRQARLLAMQKSLFQSVKLHANKKQVMVFVADRKQARLTALDLILAVSAENNPSMFLNFNNFNNNNFNADADDDAKSKAEFNRLAQTINEKHLKHMVQFGIVYIYEGMESKERRTAEQLYISGLAQIVVVSYKLCWDLPSTMSAYCVLVLDTSHFDGQDGRYVDYAVPDILQMLGYAQLVSTKSESTKCIVFTHSPAKEHYKKFLYEPFPVESLLNHFLPDHFNAEIVAKSIQTKQDCVDWLTWTFFYRRLSQNPNFYNLCEISGVHINDYLSELIETSIEELENAKCITVDEDEVVSSNLGIIANYYYIKHTTMDALSQSVSANCKLQDLIWMVSGAAEFDTLMGIRHREDKLLRDLNSISGEEGIRYPIIGGSGSNNQNSKCNEPQAKTSLLLQAHFSRLPLSPDFQHDQHILLVHIVPFVLALVDIISSHNWLKPAIAAMQLCQSIVQARWPSDSPLLQLPHMTPAIVQTLNAKFQVADISDFMSMEDQTRLSVLQELSAKQIEDIAAVCNQYPSVSLTLQVHDEGNLMTRNDICVSVQINRDVDDDDEDLKQEEIQSQNKSKQFELIVAAPYYPVPKEEFWWVMIGDIKRNSLLALKRVQVQSIGAKVDMIFQLPEPGKYALTLYLICDSYIGCEEGEKFELNISQASEEQQNIQENEQN